MDEVVADAELLLLRFLLLEEQQVERHDSRCAEQGIGKHIDDDMGGEPRTLQCRHQCLGVYLWLEQVDTNEDERKDGGECENPLVFPSAIDEQSGEGQEEGIPQTRFAHGAQGWSFECYPEQDDEREEYRQSCQGHCYGLFATVSPCKPCTNHP